MGSAREVGEVRLSSSGKALGARIARVAVCPANAHGQRAAGPLPATGGLRIDVDVDVPAAEKIDVFLHCYNDEQVIAFSGGSFSADDSGPLLGAGTHRFSCKLPGPLLNDGAYSLDVQLVRNRHDVVDSHPSVISFTLADDFPRVPGWHWRPPGVIRPAFQWTREQL
jgi:hypothetical protein